MADFDYNVLEKTVGRNGKCTWRCVIMLVLLVIVIGLIIFIGLTYGLKIDCDDNGDTNTSHTNTSSKNSSKIHNSTDKSNNTLSFLLFSDVHLDLMYNAKASAARGSFCRNESMPSTYNAPYGRIGCDSPLTLLQEVLNAMKEQASNIPRLDFIMLSGDTCAHGLSTNTTVRRQQALEIMNTTSKAVRSFFPSTPYFPSIGNNDLPGHYVMPGENDTWYSDLLKIWQDAILCKDCKMKYETTTEDELRRTFLYGGYYRVSIADGNMTLLVLNSMYWTKSTWRPDKYFVERAQVQLLWLKDQLQLARSLNKKVIITSHIPPGVDLHSSQSLWFSNFTEHYLDLVGNKFSDVVAGQIFAHFHKDGFRFLQTNKAGSLKNSSFILLMPSLSTVYRNNPNFRVVHLDPNLQAIKDYEQYFMNLVMVTEFNNSVWQLDYKFSSRYPASGDDDQVINGKRIKNLSDNLINQSDDSFFTGYISSRQVRYQPDPYSRFKHYCAVRYYSQADFDVCHKKYLVPGG